MQCSGEAYTQWNLLCDVSKIKHDLKRKGDTQKEIIRKKINKAR
jgi:hypothetical protein